MIKLLVLAIDKPHPDPEQDNIWGHRRGDPINFLQRGFEWGKEECLPTFYRIEIPDAEPEDLKHLLRPDIQPGSVTRKWYKETYDKAVIKNQFEGFLSRPTVLNHESVPHEELVTPEEWAKNNSANSYLPFTVKPFFRSVVLPDGRPGFKLTGQVDYVNLEGMANQVVKRCPWSIEIDKLPEENLKELNEKGTTEIGLQKISEFIVRK